uniref:Uncharacterized protein n=1 Tax=Anguilla anguilla TaxID=7936 RepID=A0A0E9R836_ANGAN
MKPHHNLLVEQRTTCSCNRHSIVSRTV